MTIYEFISLAVNSASLFLELLSYLRNSRSNKEYSRSRGALLKPLTRLCSHFTEIIKWE